MVFYLKRINKVIFNKRTTIKRRKEISHEDGRNEPQRNKDFPPVFLYGLSAHRKRKQQRREKAGRRRNRNEIPRETRFYDRCGHAWPALTLWARQFIFYFYLPPAALRPSLPRTKSGLFLFSQADFHVPIHGRVYLRRTVYKRTPCSRNYHKCFPGFPAGINIASANRALPRI